MQVRPPCCESCPIGPLTQGFVKPLRPSCQTLHVATQSGERELATGKPLTGGAGSWWRSLLKTSHLSEWGIAVANVLPCRPPMDAFPGTAESPIPGPLAKAGVEHCLRHNLIPLIQQGNYERIVALGNEAMSVLTGKLGIKRWRGSPLALRPDYNLGDTPVVMPTLSMDDMGKNMKFYDTVRRDFTRKLELVPENYTLFATAKTLSKLSPKKIVIDFEWYDVEQGKVVDHITHCGIAIDESTVYVGDMTNPAIAAEMKRIVENAEEICGHNLIGAEEAKWKPLGWNPKGKLYDTMLAQHLVEPDMPHSLDHCASDFTTAVHWKGKGGQKEDDATGIIHGGQQWRTWNSPNAIPIKYGGYGGCKTAEEAFRLYNARDCAYNFQIWTPIFYKLEAYQMTHVYENVSIPSSRIAREVSDQGWPIDGSRVAAIRERLTDEIEELEKTLPPELQTHMVPKNKQVPLPPGTYKEKTKTCKGTKKDGTAHEPVELVFTRPTTKFCPSCNKPIPSGKMHERKIETIQVEEPKTPWQNPNDVRKYAESLGLKPYYNAAGNRTADRSARTTWGKSHPEFLTINALVAMQKLMNTFAKPTWVDEPRLYFSLLPVGTSEGRWSSRGMRKGLDPNIQNQPKAVRQIYLPEQPGFGLLQADFKSGENWITAWLARDKLRLLRLLEPGYSEHADLASRIFGYPIDRSNKAHAGQYTTGKRINHGKNYGMGIRKLKGTLELEDLYYSEKELKEFDAIWAEMNPGTARWQKEVQALARKQSFLRNDFGRVRWFNDRSSINTESLAFLPASTLADIKIRCLMALHPDRFERELDALGVEVRCPLPPDCLIKAEIHDSIIVSGPDESRIEQAQALHAVMTQQWPVLDNFYLDIDLEYSTDSWGACATLEGVPLPKMPDMKELILAKC